MDKKINPNVVLDFETATKLVSLASKNASQNSSVIKHLLELVEKSKNNFSTRVSLPLFIEKVGGGSNVLPFKLGEETEGEPLQRTEYWRELIPLLRENSIIRKLATIVPVGTGKLQIMKQTGGATAFWVDEAQNITPSKPNFNKEYLIPKKLASLIPISNDVLRYEQFAGQYIQDEIIKCIAEMEDYTLIMSDGTSPGKPKGLYGWAGTVVDASGKTEEEVIKNAIQALASSKALKQPVWILPTKVKIHLQFLRDDNGQKIFPELENNLLAGYSVISTSLIPYSSNVTTAFLLEPSALLLGQGVTLLLEFFPNGTYYDGANVLSGISGDFSIFRALEEIDFFVKWQEAVVRIDNIDW